MFFQVSLDQLEQQWSSSSSCIGLKYKDIKSVLYRSHSPDAELMWKCVNLKLLRMDIDIDKR